jgi:hypothetical protein
MDFWQCATAVYEVTFQIREQMHLPPYQGSTLDGALDRALHAVVCLQRKKECQKCPSSPACPYLAIFEPQDLTQKIQGDAETIRRYNKTPRPYVIEPPLERKVCYLPSERLTFRVLLFGRGIRYLPWLIVALQLLEQKGLGRGRAKMELLKIRTIHPLSGRWKPIYQKDYEAGLHPNGSLLIYPEEIFQKAKEFESEEVTLEFLTPTRIKHQGKWVARPTFAQLFLAISRRAKLLSMFYGNGGKMAEPEGLLEEAENISLKSSTLRWRDWKRYSRRQKETMTLGGVVGRATYVGENLSKFMPCLVLGQLIHVGKSHFGMGKYVIQENGAFEEWK